MKSALDFLRADPNVAASFKDAARIVDECAAELRESNEAARLASTPIAADLLRLRALLAQRADSRLTVLEVNQLALLARESIDLLERKHAKPLTDAAQVVGILMDAGVSVDEHHGDPAVYFESAEELMNLGRIFTERAPQMASSIMRAAKVDYEGHVVFWRKAA